MTVVRAARNLGRQRVLLVHRFFSPDVTTYALMLERFAHHLADRGHDVTILCGYPSYNHAHTGTPERSTEHSGHVTIKRVRTPGTKNRLLKAVDYAWFGLRTAVHGAFVAARYDVISVTTIPPIIMGKAGRFCARLRGSRLVYHCMDLYPEVATAVGLSPNGRLSSWATRMDKSTIDGADRTIVLSTDMRDTLARRGCDMSRVAVCNNFAIVLPSADSESTDCPSSPFELVFAGNLGRFQGLEELVDAVARLAAADVPIRLTLMGAGAVAAPIEARAAAVKAPIRVLQHGSPDQAFEVVSRADAAVVSLAAGVIRAAYPSKLITALVCGAPVLAVVESDSELAKMVRDRSLGVVARPGDPSSIAAGIRALMQGSVATRDQIRQVGLELFDPGRVLDRWVELYWS